MKKTLSTLFIVLMISNSYAGGGWPQEKGKGFFKLSQSVLRSKEIFGPGGNPTELSQTFSLYSTSVYGEYGFTDRLTGVINVPLFVRSTINALRSNQKNTITDPGDELNAFGDVDLGFKYGIVNNGKIAISAGLTLGLPSGNSSGGESGILQSGDGEFNQLLTVEVSKSFNKVYGTVLLGVNNRSNDFSEEFRYGFEIGYSASSKLNLALKTNGVKSFFNGDPGASANGSLFSNNIEYLVLSPEVSYSISKKTGISASAALPAFGKSVVTKPNYNFGIFLIL